MQHTSKMNLICNKKWRWVALKSFGKELNPVQKSLSDALFFRNDGTFEKEMYGQLKFKGKWAFNTDSSKLDMAITEMNGQALAGMALGESHPTDSIMRLTKDTLIIAKLAYFGPKNIYGHDDWYYVKEK
ncbi:hypothetical protein [uncultured Mucilaginibacter sp.]|uniref:hypothetical protein n=1 Tax=uncultured Mucilaginibacter sp. TaxID=797541 RepID=UPI0025D8F416|nr:hypothetical protein [uncultured Mucilaginibacter sp.]